MRATQQTALVAYMFLTLAGCGDMPPPAGGLGIHILRLSPSVKEGLMPGNDDAFVPCITWNYKPALVIWSDAPKGTFDGNYKRRNQVPTGKGVLIYRGTVNQPDLEVPISGEVENIGKGEFTINGETYDLAKGAVFLVSGVGGDLQVKQLSRDMNQLSLDPHELVAFGEADSEITRFFNTSRGED